MKSIEFTKQLSFNVSDITTKENAIAYVRNLINEDKLPIDYRDVCSVLFDAVLFNNKLYESIDAASKAFVAQFNLLDQFDNLHIAVGSKVAIINALLTRAHLELWGFTTPKTITKIYTTDDGDNIKIFEFDNNPADIWPKREKATYNGIGIDHSIFFGSKKDAEQALLTLLMSADGEIPINNHII
jgi:hypothetical protein